MAEKKEGTDPLAPWGLSVRQVFEKCELPFREIIPNGLVVALMKYLSGFAQAEEKSQHDLYDFLHRLSKVSEGALPSRSTVWSRAKAIVKKRGSLAKSKVCLP